jgi:hypothetical protein
VLLHRAHKSLSNHHAHKNLPLDTLTKFNIALRP